MLFLAGPGGALAAVAFTLCGFQAIHATHEPLYSLMPYLPLALLLADLYTATGRLVWLAVWIMLMRYLDLFWIIEPNFSKTLNLTLADVVVPVAIGGFWLAYFFRNLSSLPLLPAYDVSANEVLEPAHE